MLAWKPIALLAIIVDVKSSTKNYSTKLQYRLHNLIYLWTNCIRSLYNTTQKSKNQTKKAHFIQIKKQLKYVVLLKLLVLLFENPKIATSMTEIFAWKMSFMQYPSKVRYIVKIK